MLRIKEVMDTCLVSENYCPVDENSRTHKRYFVRQVKTINVLVWLGLAIFLLRRKVLVCFLGAGSEVDLIDGT